MARKRWVGLRSPSFRRTLFVAVLIVLFFAGLWIGRRTAGGSKDQVEALENQLNILQRQVEQLKKN